MADTHVVCLPIALGRETKSVCFDTGTEIGVTTSKVVDRDEERAAATVDVEMVCGDDLTSSRRRPYFLESDVPVPNVVKIDV
jgi:hypothetical protein